MHLASSRFNLCYQTSVNKFQISIVILAWSLFDDGEKERDRRLLGQCILQEHQGSQLEAHDCCLPSHDFNFTSLSKSVYHSTLLSLQLERRPRNVSEL